MYTIRLPRLVILYHPREGRNMGRPRRRRQKLRTPRNLKERVLEPKTQTRSWWSRRLKRGSTMEIIKSSMLCCKKQNVIGACQFTGETFCLCLQDRNKLRWVLCQLTCAGRKIVFSMRSEKIKKPAGANSNRSSKNMWPSFIETSEHEEIWQRITIFILKWMGLVAYFYSWKGSLFVLWVGGWLILRADWKRWKIKKDY
jgi:hypothetical protein